jgi:mevalonate kinase
MIIGTLALLNLLLGGGPGIEALLPADFNDRVEMYVTDENKADDIKNIVDLMNDEVGKFNDKLDDLVEQFHDINSDYLSTTSDLSDTIDEIFKERQKVLKSLIVMRSKIRDLVTEEQWNKLFDRNTEPVK